MISGWLFFGVLVCPFCPVGIFGTLCLRNKKYQAEPLSTKKYQKYQKYFQLSPGTNPVIFRTNPIIFRKNPVVFRTNPAIFRIHPVVFRKNPDVFSVGSFEVILWLF